ncbi:transcription cofactor HES-6-like isoform X1 [Astyanax mexicanus]|uniref:Transcription cofactor HES-6-like isoform X1 n=1 Tax=Astyanax mexicanus TaxID=7994 RepID=A0A8T2M3H8_ASTMX|nr:transcription cofactor HES-6-like isoform X1 [Astyanax mexicanus]
MAPASRNSRSGPGRSEEDCYNIRGDRKTRKPLVEKKRRARINESLQELRILLADSDAQTKMENAEVLEMTVKRVESILQNRAKAADSMNREASEHFAAGYIQCMHEVHTFVSSCPGIDAAVAADLLNHLLECMPLNSEERFQDVLTDLLSEPGHYGLWHSESPREITCSDSESGGSSSDLSLSPSGTSSDDLSSDGEDTASEHGQGASDNQDVRDLPISFCSKSMWRPW